jgi:hypothetical protein
MTLADLELVLGWAADEGWNPGLDDAPAFHMADPTGFLIKEVDGAPVAAISVVNHDANFAFLGLYLCKPEYRGQGHGLDIWNAGITHAGTRSIGLDGVPDQQANYARSGFVKYGSTIRYAGTIDAAPDPRIRAALPSEFPKLIARDLQATGINRGAFADAWLSQTLTRQTVVLVDGTEQKGFATFRRCGTGLKIGPLYASSEADTRALLASSPFLIPDEMCFIDVQSHNSGLTNLLQKLEFKPVFETARMFRGKPPETDPVHFQAIATMELG